MYISAFLHKDELFEITNRWLSNRLEPADPLQITRIITYDSFVAWERLLQLIGDLSRSLPNLTVYKKISTKKELKDYLCNATGGTERVRHIISKYRKLPEYYYIGSPIAAWVYHDPHDRITGMCRFKRVKRIAEKASRYASLHIVDQVRQTADELSKKLGGKPGAPHTIKQAKKKHLFEIKNHGIALPASIMTIKDVLGLKIIKNGVSEQQLELELSRLAGATIVEKEVHSGKYNAIHYVLELTVDLNYMIHKFKNRSRNGAYGYRGLPAHELNTDFEQFLGSGSNTVQVDLIFTSLDELIESEVGRSMHETRIFKQRQQQHNFGNITVNIEYIIEYLLAVGMSPATHIEDIPIKLWGRYLPDALSYRIRKLYELPEYSIIDY